MHLLTYLLATTPSTNETLLFNHFLIMYNLRVFTCIILIFVFHCTHVRMSYVLNSYLLTYLLASHRQLPLCLSISLYSYTEWKLCHLLTTIIRQVNILRTTIWCTCNISNMLSEHITTIITQVNYAYFVHTFIKIFF